MRLRTLLFLALCCGDLSAQSLENSQTDLATKAGLCEARYRADGFSSAMAFIVDCVNPAFEEFYVAMNAPDYMYESVKTQALLMGAKVDANEVDFDTAIRNIAAVASATFNSLFGEAESIEEDKQVEVSRQKIISECARTAEIAQSSLKSQYDNQWLVFLQNNPMPTGVSANQQAMMVLNGQLNTAGVVGMDMQRQEQQQLWQQRIAQSRALHDNQQQNAMISTYNSTMELCKIQNGVN